MKAVLLAILFIWLSASAGYAQKACDKWRSTTTSGTISTVEKVAGIPNKRIYLCGYVLIPAGNKDLEFELTSGTGLNCSQDSAPLLGPLTLPQNAAIVNRIPYAGGEVTPPGHSVCLRTFGTGTLLSIFYWTQF